MSQFSEMRKAFNRELVAHAIGNPEHFREAFPLGSQLPKPTLEAWLKRFHRIKDEFDPQPRHINRFKLGADPEFIFNTVTGDRCDAHNLNLKQGLAFGEDNNGRLCEIRPHPDRSALKVVASILATLRWLYVLNPTSREFAWVTGVFVQRDGLGGHVHFGRKRPTRIEEVRALDIISDMVNRSGIYNPAEIRARQQGDARGQRYGMPGDIRLQGHGYEYRTFPSWLDNPQLAFLMITLSKLAVQDPTLVETMSYGNRPVQAIKNLLAYYRDRDDDARLACLMLRQGQSPLPTHIGGDFRTRWGIPIGQAKIETNVSVIPRSIPPSESCIEELFNCLSGKDALLFNMPSPTWGPIKPPDGYLMCINSTFTMQQKGLGEMVWDFCSSDKLPISFDGLGHGNWAMYVGTKLARKLPAGWKEKLGPIKELVKISDTINGQSSIAIGTDFREGPRKKLLRNALSCGAFPLWKVSEVKETSFEEWSHINPPKENNFVGKVLFQSGKEFL